MELRRRDRRPACVGVALAEGPGGYTYDREKNELRIDLYAGQDDIDVEIETADEPEIEPELEVEAEVEPELEVEAEVEPEIEAEAAPEMPEAPAAEDSSATETNVVSDFHAMLDAVFDTETLQRRRQVRTARPLVEPHPLPEELRLRPPPSAIAPGPNPSLPAPSRLFGHGTAAMPTGKFDVRAPYQVKPRNVAKDHK